MYKRPYQYLLLFPGLNDEISQKSRIELNLLPRFFEVCLVLNHQATRRENRLTFQHSAVLVETCKETFHASSLQSVFLPTKLPQTIKTVLLLQKLFCLALFTWAARKKDSFSPFCIISWFGWAEEDWRAARQTNCCCSCCCCCCCCCCTPIAEDDPPDVRASVQTDRPPIWN